LQSLLCAGQQCLAAGHQPIPSWKVVLVAAAPSRVRAPWRLAHGRRRCCLISQSKTELCKVRSKMKGV